MAALYSSIADYLSGVQRGYPHDSTSTPYTVYPEADRVAYINEAREEISTELRTNSFRNSFTTTAGQATYHIASVCTNCFCVDAVTYGTVPLEKRNSRDDIDFALTRTDDATPGYFFTDDGNNYIVLLPTPDANTTCYMQGWKTPTPMVMTRGTPGTYTYYETSAVPINARRMPVYYALWRGFERDGIADGITRAQYYQNLYNQEMAKAKGRIKNQQFQGVKGKVRFKGYGLRNTSGYD